MPWARLAKGSVRRTLMEWPDEVPTRHRANNPEPEGRPCPRTEGQPGIVARGRRGLHGGAEGKRLPRHRNQPKIRQPTAITAASRRETPPSSAAWDRHSWPGSNAVVMVESSRETGGKIEQETRFYITSLVMLAHLLGLVVRRHRAIENSLHWVMEMMSATTSAACEPITRQPIHHHQAHGP
jgi:predicted transposase YbfD/YdcC